MSNSSTLILVPVYNGVDTLPSLLSKLAEVPDCDLHVVDDGSTDGTVEFLMKSDYSHSLHTRNRGKGAAIRTGAQCAIAHSYLWILTIDADLQHPPNSIPYVLVKREKRTIAIGHRANLSPMPLFRILSNRFTSLLLSIRTNTLLRDSQCGFRLIPVKLFEEIDLSENGFQLESELLIKASLAGYRIEHVEIPTIYGTEKSAMRNFRDTTKFAAMYFKSFLW